MAVGNNDSRAAVPMFGGSKIAAGTPKAVNRNRSSSARGGVDIGGDPLSCQDECARNGRGVRRSLAEKRRTVHLSLIPE